MEVFIVVRRVSSLEASRKLPEEELEDVAKFVLIVGRVRRVESEEVGEAARGVRLDAAVLVEENGGVDEIFADGVEGGDVDVLLVHLCELLVELLEFLLEGVGGEALADELVAEAEFLGGGLPRRARCDHGGREGASSERGSEGSPRQSAIVAGGGGGVERARSASRVVVPCFPRASIQPAILTSPTVAAPSAYVFALDLAAVSAFLVALAMPPAGIPPSRALPSKESGLFKEVLHYYEDRQLKKGLKTADTILKKFPNHGGTSRTRIRDALMLIATLVETLCMKGLILTHLGRRDEGLELVKQGVRLDLTSHICWHVFGLIQKGQKNYEEALKSYTQALRFDKVCTPYHCPCMHICYPSRRNNFGSRLCCLFPRQGRTPLPYSPICHMHHVFYGLRRALLYSLLSRCREALTRHTMVVSAVRQQNLHWI